jgi:hypothetical protein
VLEQSTNVNNSDSTGFPPKARGNDDGMANG